MAIGLTIHGEDIEPSDDMVLIKCKRSLATLKSNEVKKREIFLL